MRRVMLLASFCCGIGTFVGIVSPADPTDSKDRVVAKKRLPRGNIEHRADVFRRQEEQMRQQNQQIKLQNQAIADVIAHELRTSKLQGYDIGIYVKNGTVTLTGEVISAAEKDRATQCASKVFGAMKVDNQLEVSQRRGLVKKTNVNEHTNVESDDDVILTDPIFAIMIEGNKAIETTTIRKLIKSEVNKPATEATILGDARALYDTDWFFSVEPRYRRTDKGLVLVYRVIERPLIK